LNDDAFARARVGAVLNEKWTLEKLLGIGGMGAVYAGRHRNGARAAVKVLHAELARHVALKDRFLREGYAANRVEHPGAVKVIDDDVITSGPDEGTAYLVMELLVGESLQDRVERGPPVREQEFLTIAASVLDVLEAAHARGVVHRDLKPENVFLAREEGSNEPRVKVLDFGLARLLDAHPTTMQGVALGTPSYMSPEQAAGRHEEIDGRADLFSLAATGFRLVAGRRIHEGDSPVELVTKMASLPAPPIRDVAPHASIPFARVIDRALAFRREDRYPDAAAMREDVRRANLELRATVDSLSMGEAPTIVAMPASVTKPTETIELSTTDFQSAETTDASGADLRPTIARATAPVSDSDLRPTIARTAEKGLAADQLPTIVEPRPPVSVKPKSTGVPPSSRKASPASLRKPDVPSPPRPPSPRKPATSRDRLPPPSARNDDTPPPPEVAPPRKRPSFIPVLTALVLGGIALKLAMDVQPTPPEPASREVPSARELEDASPASATSGLVEAPDAPTEATKAVDEIDAALVALDAAPDAEDASDAAVDAADAGDADAEGEDLVDEPPREPARPVVEPVTPGPVHTSPAKPPAPKPRPPVKPRNPRDPRRRGHR
jgi:serine/threonine protein kinase